MPIVKPSSLPRWGEEVGDQEVIGPAEVIPVPGKLDIGWDPGEEPPAQYFNWWMRLTYDWIQYLDDLTNQALVFTAQLTVPAPSAGGSPANKTYVDTTDKAAAHTWSAQQQFGGNTLQDVGTPVNPDDAATKDYVDNSVPTATWVDLTSFINANWHSGNFQGYIDRNRVEIRGRINPLAGASTVTLLTLPAAFRPVANISFLIPSRVSAGTVNTWGKVTIDLLGNVSLDAVGTGTGLAIGDFHQFQMIYEKTGNVGN